MTDDPTRPNPWGPPPGASPPPFEPPADPATASGPGPAATPPQPPGLQGPPTGATAPARSGSRFGVGLLVGLLIGVVVGGLAGGLVGFLVSDAEPVAITLDGDGGPVPFDDFGMDDTSPPSVETSREQPAPIGTTISIGNGWDVTVSAFDADATDAVLSADEFAEPPPDGERFVLVELEATYVDGAEPSESPFFGMDLGLVGASNVEHTEFDAACTAPEPEFDNTSELYPGGTARGNVCFVLPDEDAESAVLVVNPSMSFDATKSYFALR